MSKFVWGVEISSRQEVAINIDNISYCYADVRQRLHVLNISLKDSPEKHTLIRKSLSFGEFERMFSKIAFKAQFEDNKDD